MNKEAIESAQQEIAEVKQTADEAVDSINTAVANAGFTSLDETISSVQAISNQAQTNAGTAIDNALEAMQQASQAVDNTGSLNVRVDEVEGTLELKADSQEIDTLSGVVDTHTLDIQANAEGLALKANQDTVDTLAGTVQSLGSEFDIVAGQVSSKVWNTDIETAIDGIEVGGRNLLPAFTNNRWSGFSDYVEFISPYELLFKAGSNNHIHLSITLESKTNYTMTFNSDHQRYYIYELINGELGSIVRTITEGSDVFTFNTGDVTEYQIRLNSWSQRVDVDRKVWNLKLEKGNTATDWSPAPEDTDAKIDYVESEMIQRYDSITSTVSSIDGRVSKQEQTVSGMQSIVYDPERGVASLNTQLADLVQVAVTGEELSNAITVSEQGILAETVRNGEVVARINQEAGTTLIENNRIYLAAETVAFSGSAFIPGAYIENASIDNAKIADATISSAKIANLDVNKLSGNATEFVESYWNQNGSDVRISSSGIVTTASNGSQGLIQNGVFLARQPSNGATVGYIGYDQVGNSPAMTVTTSLGSHFKVRQHLGGGTYKDVFQLNANDGSAMFSAKSIFMGNHEINAQEKYRLYISGNESIALIANNRTIMAMSASSGTGYARFFNNLDMGGYFVRNAAGFELRSERKYKTNIIPINNAMETMEQMDFYSYNKSGVPELGIIADEAPDEVLSQDKKNVNLYSYATLIGKSQQELISRVKDLEQELEALKGMIA